MNYTLTLSPDAHRALAWIADRYTSAEVLYDGSEYDEDTQTLTVPEHVAHNYLDELPQDNGVEGAVLPPCAGGPLAEALISLYEQIV